MTFGRITRLVTLALLVALIGNFVAESASAQAVFGSLRGRTVSRDGLFRVQKTRWGNGITPTGGQVILGLGELAVPIISAATGREGDGSRDAASRAEGTERLSSHADYIKAYNEAIVLLARTEALAKGTTTTTAPAVAVQQDVTTIPPITKLPSGNDLGLDPWNQ